MSWSMTMMTRSALWLWGRVRWRSEQSGGARLKAATTGPLDPRDGHIWRSKYCVLEEGVLYFYRTAMEEASPEDEPAAFQTNGR
mmetsp:Transcript_28954/g.69784  ORF Transcript_28954/g.69784 Transcript_28954/m.69784 type:complete len:84 (+) Transcript_28954:33-284(+)